MFTLPDADSGLLPFNVYYEADFRRASAGNFTPTFPYVYLLDSYLLPISQRVDVQQPQVVVEIQEYRTLPFEMGNRSGRKITAQVHVFGQNRGQRDDLASFIMDYIGASLPIKTFNANNTAGTIVETAVIDPDKVVSDMYSPRLEQDLGGTLFGWGMLEFSFLTKM